MPDAQTRLGHQNLIAYSRATTHWCTKGSFLDEGGVLVYAGGSWIPVIGNGAFATEDDVPADEVIRRADAFFARLGRGYSVKVRDTGEDAALQAACEKHELVAFGDPVPQMICHHVLESRGAPEGVVLREVDDERGVGDFAAVDTEAYATYGMPAEVFTDQFDRPDRLVADPDARIVVAYLNGRPVAAALTFFTAGVGGLQWVGTVPDARHMNLGRLVTEWATNVAFAMGATSVTLQASAMGESLYAKLGYETLYHYREFVRWTPPA
jgi:hypothetical protein